MRLLLDTHIALWALTNHPRLMPATLALIDEADELYLSAIAIFEIAIKKQKGKLAAPDDLLLRLPKIGCQILRVTAEHAWAVGQLPPIHGDPFDRLMAAQARVSGLTLMTADRMLGRYDIDVLLA